MIIEQNGKWFLKSRETGKNLGGPYDTREEALKRERQVEFFKHKDAVKEYVDYFFESINEGEIKC